MSYKLIKYINIYVKVCCLKFILAYKYDIKFKVKLNIEYNINIIKKFQNTAVAAAAAYIFLEMQIYQDENQRVESGLRLRNK